MGALGSNKNVKRKKPIEDEKWLISLLNSINKHIMLIVLKMLKHGE